ncbi:rho-related gtp-binding protein rhog [Anaeramoeba ignava]|uniref:Rho-related gtp-binding protein rhog n=1 Tax=Anaeramoeba ignava TaxID=1746090 RepID=A0A9Q0RDX8_ANAIG|nr:rho-related gtp-binding protein rhog [Anaeramoeba ignava]
MENQNENNKVVFIGNDGIGKTSLIATYHDKKIPEKYVPTVYDNAKKIFQNEDKEIEIQFWDTARYHGYDRFLPLFLSQSNLTVICFAINDYESFENIENYWILQVDHFTPNSKRILIGTKIDLRNKLKEENKKFVTKEEGIELAKKINAIKYFECSSLNQKGIETIFNEIVLICIGKYKEINQEKENKKGCILN